jgi:O-antigen ligase
MAIMAVPVAAIGAVGCTCYALGVARRPWVTIPVVVMTLPFYLHPRALAGAEFSLSEIAVLLSVAVIALRSFGLRVASFRSEPKPDARNSQLRASGLDWAVAAFLLAALLSLLVTEYPKQSLRELRLLVLEPVMLFYVARFTLTTPERMMATLWSIVVAGTLAATIAVASIALGGELADFSARATAPYLSPNHLGLFLGRAGAVALAIVLFGGRERLGRILACAALALIGIALLRSLSFGAWFGLAGAALALAALRGRRWLLAALVACASLGLVACTLMPAERTLGRLDPGTGTALSRLQVWNSSLRMLAEHPVLGVGLDNYLYLYRSQYMLPEAWKEPNISHPHNFVLHFWLELGVLGLGAALAISAWAAVRAHRLFYRPVQPLDRLLAATSAGLFVDFIVHGSLDNSYFLVDAAVIWWLGVALLAARGQQARLPIQ